MALETLRNVVQIRNEPVVHVKPMEAAPLDSTIIVADEESVISFKIQNGPIKEVGKNGCQVVDMLTVAKVMIEKLNEKFPCEENSMTLKHLDYAIFHQDERTKNRELRNVEGTSKP